MEYVLILQKGKTRIIKECGMFLAQEFICEDDGYRKFKTLGIADTEEKAINILRTGGMFANAKYKK